MTISTVDSTSAAPQTSNISMQDFLKVLLTQLTYQDPLKPMDNQQFMAQMAQFTSLQESQQMNEKMSTLISNQAALQSVGLIGRTVDIATSSGQTLSGVVTALSLAGAAPSKSITLQGGATIDNVGLNQVTGVL